MRSYVKRLMNWIDRHPRTGWYLACYSAVLVTAHVGWELIGRFL